ncbi:maleylpyruvate isomerase family mycothiol-dependent enzyme [Knoellia sp. S7-12]|uniref:maleylpyruvate isomerase family mycothiol-dependent enzyme n=1 Tax=Knoellia sp. S7-12 TaxID=3126698 RepID=UPI003368B9C1
MNSQPDANLLTRALDQTAGLLDEVTPEQYDSPSTCEDWKVGHLVRHVVASPQNFISMFAGKDVDWANPPELGEDPAADFRSGAAALLEQVKADESGGSSNAAIPEFAVHSWDLARSTGSQTSLDDEVAEHAYAFMSANLTPENRKGAFEPEVDAAADASVHDRLAAFAGRSPSTGG